MSITFRIATAADDQTGPVATITARQLAAFRSYLRCEGERIGLALLDADATEEDNLSCRFEARVGPLALAAIARIFDFDPHVIAVFDQAQFCDRPVSIDHPDTEGMITLRVAATVLADASTPCPNRNPCLPL